MPPKLPEKPTTPPDPEDIVEQVILGESAGEGPDGMKMVLDTIYNRAQDKKKTLAQIVAEPKQFTAYARPDRTEFVLRQPMMLRNLAEILVRETQDKDFKPTHRLQHYVTKDLWDKRGTLKKDHWLHNMEVVQQVGNHVLLKDKRKKP